MNICVFGLWHLGCVTAGCLAERFSTVGLDLNGDTVAQLNDGILPIFEPGLQELIQRGLAGSRLRFTNDVTAVNLADVVWVAFDTPVDEDDRADSAYVEAQVQALFPHLRSDAIVLVSSQLLVGSVRRMEDAYRRRFPENRVCFAYTPENLRLGRAVDVFQTPGRIVVGTRRVEDRERLRPLLSALCDRIVWMSVESAEMTKHALNAFLANSIAFINEIAALCEETGADAKEVENGLKTDERIGARAYLAAGGPFAGGTLARDVGFLTSAAATLGVATPVLESIRRSNDLHRAWARRKLESVLGDLNGRTIALLGLTYKPGTDTLRRSAAVELCRWLLERHANVKAFDPAVRELPADLTGRIELCGSAEAALGGCDAAVVATEWPEFRELAWNECIRQMSAPVILDANRFLSKSLPDAPGLRYVSVGMPKERS